MMVKYPDKTSMSSTDGLHESGRTMYRLITINNNKNEKRLKIMIIDMVSKHEFNTDEIPSRTGT